MTRSSAARATDARTGVASAITEAEFRQRLNRIDGLPTLPQVVTRMLNLTDDPNVSAQEIADMVGRDQAMAAAVLRLVNAPFYGLEGRISSIQHAVVLLGLRTVRNLAFSAVLVKSFGQPSRDVRFDRVRLWKHAISCAAGARYLAKRRNVSDPEEAFLAGLVHDMGIVVLDQFFHEDFRRVVDLVTAEEAPLIDAEREVFGQDHAAVGQYLARLWNFPMAVVEAIGRHHNPSHARLDPTLAAVIHIADWLDSTGGDTVVPPGDSGDPAAAAPPPPIPIRPETDQAGPFGTSGPLDDSTLGVLGLRPADLDELRLAVAEELWRTHEFLALLQ